MRILFHRIIYHFLVYLFRFENSTSIVNNSLENQNKRKKSSVIRFIHLIHLQKKLMIFGKKFNGFIRKSCYSSCLYVYILISFRTINLKSFRKNIFYIFFNVVDNFSLRIYIYIQLFLSKCLL